MFEWICARTFEIICRLSFLSGIYKGIPKGTSRGNYQGIWEKNPETKLRRSFQRNLWRNFQKKSLEEKKLKKKNKIIGGKTLILGVIPKGFTGIIYWRIFKEIKNLLRNLWRNSAELRSRKKSKILWENSLWTNFRYSDSRVWNICIYTHTQ